MVTIEIKGADELAKKFQNFPGQVAFASAKAINDTAVAVQSFEVDTQFPGKLTIRSRGTPWTKPGTKFGINIRPFATKQNQLAIVGSQADWLKLQEEGGTKKVSGHRVAIPTKFWRSNKEIMAKAKKPRTILNASRRRRELAGRAFIYAGPKMPTGIYARNQRGSRALRMLFRLVDSAHVRPVLEFFTSAKKVVDLTFQKNFERRIGGALSTARLA